MGLNNWIFWIAILWAKHHSSLNAFYMFQDHLPTCTMILPFLGLFSLGIILRNPVESFQADCATVCFCTLPGVSLVADFWVAEISLTLLGRRGQVYYHNFAHSLLSLSYAQFLFGLQSVMHVGSNPLLCFALVAASTCPILWSVHYRGPQALKAEARLTT